MRAHPWLLWTTLSVGTAVGFGLAARAVATEAGPTGPVVRAGKLSAAHAHVFLPDAPGPAVFVGTKAGTVTVARLLPDARDVRHEPQTAAAAAAVLEEYALSSAHVSLALASDGAARVTVQAADGAVMQVDIEPEVRGTRRALLHHRGTDVPGVWIDVDEPRDPGAGATFVWRDKNAVHQGAQGAAHHVLDVQTACGTAVDSVLVLEELSAQTPGATMRFTADATQAACDDAQAGLLPLIVQRADVRAAPGHGVRIPAAWLQAP